MHRFGRSAQQKLKDRWGGSFILATILALVGAWFAGTWLNDTLKGDTATNDPMQQVGDKTGMPGAGTASGTIAEDFSLYFLQVGAFRSKAGTDQLVQDLASKGYAAMAAPKGTDGLHRVYAGLYTMASTANEAKSQILADGIVTDAYVVHLPVSTNADVVPASAAAGKSGDLRKGLEAMNTYLHDVAMWIEGLAAGIPGDTKGIADKGKLLGAWANDMKKAAANDPSVGRLADLAAMASANAVDIQNAAKGVPGGEEYRTAMTGYLDVLNQYRALRAPGN